MAPSSSAEAEIKIPDLPSVAEEPAVEESVCDVDHGDDGDDVEGLAAKVVPEVEVVVVQDSAEESGILGSQGLGGLLVEIE